MTPNKTTTLLDALAARIGKPVWEVWADWYDRHLRCSGCHEIPYRCKCKDAPPYERYGTPYYTGPDLYADDPAVLVPLLAVADAYGLSKWRIRIELLCDMAADTFEASWQGHFTTYGPTRHAAILNALERAAGVAG